jgi:hypothetical protein
MRSLVLTFTFGATLVVANCTSPSSTVNTNGTANTNNSAPSRSAESGSAGQPNGLPSVSSAHGGAGSSTDAMPPATSTTTGGSAKPNIDTAIIDAKIEKAEAKAKAAGATQADKLAAAAAYLERGNVYRDAGNPTLYKFALGDYRHALRYQPNNEEARAKMDEIVSIYQSMGRPVPQNGIEP